MGILNKVMLKSDSAKFSTNQLVAHLVALFRSVTTATRRLPNVPNMKMMPWNVISSTILVEDAPSDWVSLFGKFCPGAKLLLQKPYCEELFIFTPLLQILVSG